MSRQVQNSISDVATVRRIWASTQVWLDRMERIESANMTNAIATMKAFRYYLEPILKSLQKKSHPINSQKKTDNKTLDELLDEARITNQESRLKIKKLMESIYADFHTTHEDFRRRAHDGESVKMKRVAAVILFEMNLSPRQVGLLIASNRVTAYSISNDYGDPDSKYKADYMYYTNKYRSYYAEQ